ncbi:hypothetical protein WJX79_009142 [Trebouxia sp. C0005]
MKRKLLSVPLAPSAKAGATSCQALSPDALAATSKVTEPASVPKKANLPADTGCTGFSQQTSSGNASSAKVTPAPAKRRKLLVLGSNKDSKVQQTDTLKHSSPSAGAKCITDDGPHHCKTAAWSMPEVQKTQKLKPKSVTPHAPGKAAAAVVKASGVPKAFDRAKSQQAEHNPAVREDDKALPCEAAIFGTQHGGPVVSTSSDRLAQSSVSTSEQPRFDNRKAEVESLGLQLSMPSTTNVLRQIPKPAFQGLHNPAVQGLCAPGMLKGLQAELWPQKLLATDADTNAHSIAADMDAASWVICSSQHVNTARLVQELCKSFGSSKSLKLVVPSVTGQYKPVCGFGLPGVLSSAEAADTAPSRKHVSDPTSGGHESGGQPGAHDVRCLVATQQSEFADIWKSPEKQEDECNRAVDAFPISLSFLQAVLG